MSTIDFSQGKFCFYCGAAAEQVGHAHSFGRCAYHQEMFTEDLRGGLQQNRLLAEIQNPDSYRNRVFEPWWQMHMAKGGGQ